jgi:single-stranded-DNA-specific exonuclease
VTIAELRARPKARWLLPAEPDRAAVERLREELHLPTAICRLIATRGLDAPDDAKAYLRPRLDQLHDPHTLMDVDRAVERLSRAIRDRETIFVHGDYDVDGICSTTITVKTIRHLGGTAIPFIPQRLMDGYDLTNAGVRAAKAAGATVVVTCDCGTSALRPIADLQESGIDVIVTDHHLPGGPLPLAYAVLNPKRPGCQSPDKDLAAVGVAFKLALALTRAMGGNENPVLGMLDFVALDVRPHRLRARAAPQRGRSVGQRAPRRRIDVVDERTGGESHRA